MIMTLPVLTSGFILAAGVVDDLRSRKFHNWLFLTCCVLGAVVVAISGGMHELLFAGFGFFAGFIILLPLVLTGLIGAGDMKLLAAFGLVAGWDAVLTVAVLSLFWGAIFGVVRVLADKQGRAFFKNLSAIATLQKRENLVLHRMPYTVALFMGWLSYLVLEGAR